MKALLGLVLVIAGNLHADTRTIKVTNTKIYWDTYCDAEKGLISHAPKYALRNTVGVDAFGAAIVYSHFDKDKKEVEINGFAYGFLCEEQIDSNDKKTYKWKVVSLDQNPNVNVRLVSRKSLFREISYDLELDSKRKFKIVADSDEFLGKKKTNQLLEDVENVSSEIEVIFDVNSNLLPRSEKRSPYFSFSYKFN